MKKNYTKIVFLLDRSGSMRSCASDVIGGYNQYIKTQKDNAVGECSVSLYRFDDVYEKVYVNVPVNDVSELRDVDFVPRGNTALLDSVCRMIDDVGIELNNLHEDERPEKVIVIIYTDGEENCSSTYTIEDVRERIQRQTDVYKWEFVYVGANQNSWSVGQSYGIGGNNTMNYVSRGKNTSISSDMLWKTLATKTVSYRSNSAGDMKFTPAEQQQQNSLVANNVP